MSIPAGTYYVAEQVPNETVDARQNAAIGILTNNVWIRGAGKTNTFLIAFDRNTTIFYLGASLTVRGLAVTNFVLSDMTLQGRPHIVATNDAASGGFTNYYELGALDPLLWGNGTAQSGCLFAVVGFNESHLTRSATVQNVRFKHADRAVVLSSFTSEFLVRSNEFICWDGPDSEYTGALNSPPSPRTANYPPWSPSIFAGNGDVVIMENSYNGTNGVLTGAVSGYEPHAPDGFVWMQAGGNWFISRNSITNYQLEAIQLNAGPAAVVQNTFKSYVHNFSTCAFIGIASQASLTGQSADDAFAFVGNTVDGGRHGVLGLHNPYNYDRPFKLNVSGNTFALQDPFNIEEDFPGAAVSLATCERAIICGNTLTAGGRGVWIGGPGHLTNAVVLKNDFARVNFSGVYDDSFGTNLLSAVVAKNSLGQGAAYHLKLRYQDATHWFMLSNQFTAWTNYTVITNFLADPRGSPVHSVQ